MRLCYRSIERRLQDGAWRQLQRGVYQLSPAAPTLAQREIAALLAAGQGAVLSHHSAARHWRLDLLRTELHISIPARRAILPLENVTLHRVNRLEPRDLAARGPLRLTRPARTVLDLATVLDPTELRVAFDSALRGSTDVLGALQRALRSHGPHPGHAALRSLLVEHLERRDVPDSALESLAMELALLAAGWRVLRFTWTDLANKRDHFIAELQRLVRSAGHAPPNWRTVPSG